MKGLIDLFYSKLNPNHHFASVIISRMMIRRAFLEMIAFCHVIAVRWHLKSRISIGKLGRSGRVLNAAAGLEWMRPHKLRLCNEGGAPVWCEDLWGLLAVQMVEKCCLFCVRGRLDKWLLFASAVKSGVLFGIGKSVPCLIIPAFVFDFKKNGSGMLSSSLFAGREKQDIFL
ncbi:hypothetical protein AVEN_53345-1 [Araneus ventricosus]|uniref:Uncharacterized protein n=1 Tax=Araneus ventricosus TaxID=182803 RepID=A0A4Y2AA15_ARAVE|nr:hypothetical protein AVEN_53345-1 [Araneus ventricosus]